MNIYGYALLAIVILYVVWFSHWLYKLITTDEITEMNKALEKTFEGDNNVN